MHLNHPFPIQKRHYKHIIQRKFAKINKYTCFYLERIEIFSTLGEILYKTVIL